MKNLVIILLVLFCAMELASFASTEEGQFPEEADIDIQEEDAAEPGFQEPRGEDLPEER